MRASSFVVIACLTQTVAASNWLRFSTTDSVETSAYDSEGFASLDTGLRFYPYNTCIVNTLGSFKWTEVKNLLDTYGTVVAAAAYLDWWVASQDCGSDGSSPTRLTYDTFSILNTTSMEKSGAYSVPMIDYVMGDSTYLQFSPLYGIDAPQMTNKLLLNSGPRTYYYQEGQDGTSNCPAQPSEVYGWSRRSAETTDVEKAPVVQQLQAEAPLPPQGTESARRSLSCDMYSDGGGSMAGPFSTTCATSTKCMRLQSSGSMLQQCGELEGKDVCAQITVADGTCCTHTEGTDTTKFICSATAFSGAPQASDFTSCSESCGIPATTASPTASATPSPPGASVTTGALVAVDVVSTTTSCLLKAGIDLTSAANSYNSSGPGSFEGTYVKYECTAGQPNKVSTQTFSVSTCVTPVTDWNTTSLPSCALVTAGAKISSQPICSAAANCIGSGCEEKPSSGSNVGMIVGIAVAVLVVLGCIAFAVYWYVTSHSVPAPKPDPDASVDHVELEENASQLAVGV